jgi:hypothetical protein
MDTLFRSTIHTHTSNLKYVLATGNNKETMEIIKVMQNKCTRYVKSYGMWYCWQLRFRRRVWDTYWRFRPKVRLPSHHVGARLDLRHTHVYPADDTKQCATSLGLQVHSVIARVNFPHEETRGLYRTLGEQSNKLSSFSSSNLQNNLHVLHTQLHQVVVKHKILNVSKIK